MMVFINLFIETLFYSYLFGLFLDPARPLLELWVLSYKPILKYTSPNNWLKCYA